MGHTAQDISSAIFVLDQLNRTQNIPFHRPIELNATLPFVKYLHQFSLPTGEDVILGKDFLGIALKINGSGFDPTQYQIGYANIPLDLLELLLPDYQFSSTKTSIVIRESIAELQVDLTYSNVLFLFHNGSMGLDNLITLNYPLNPEQPIIAAHFMLVQLDKITFTFVIRKYTHYGASGVETYSKITLGNVINLIINEELPTNQNWPYTSEYKIQENFLAYFRINETLSLYTGSDIRRRLKQFSNISLSLITSQYIGLLNGTKAINTLTAVIDNENKEMADLRQTSFPVTEEISMFYKEKPIFSSKIKGYNFALQGENPDNITLIPVKTQIVALNQPNSLISNLLFSEETSLFRELVAESMKRFIANSEVSDLSTYRFSSVCRLDLSSSRYIQDFQVQEWGGSMIAFNSLEYAVKISSLLSEDKDENKITFIPIFPGIVALLYLKKRKRMKTP